MMLFRKLFPCMLLAICFPATGSDQQKIKSLYHQLESLTGNKRVPVLISIAQEYEATSDTVLYVLEEALDLLRQHPDAKLKASVHNYLGIYYTDIRKEKKALDFYFKSINGYKKLGDRKGQSHVYNNIGSLYLNLRNYPSAKSYYEKGLAIRKLENDSAGIAKSLNNIAAVHYEMNQFEEAANTFSEILTKYGSVLKQEHHAIITNNIGCCYLETKKYIDAKTYFHEGARIYENLNNIEGISLVYGNLAKTSLGLEQYNEAIEYGKKSLELATEIKSNDLMETACTSLRKAYLALGDYSNAYAYLLQEKNLRDTIYNQETRDVITEMETKYKTREKENENKLLENKNKIQSLEINRSRYFILALVAVLVIGGLLTLLFLRQNRIKSQQRTLQAEQKLLRAQMNPHFIFNSLTAIEAFIYSNNPREAGRYLSDFARLMRLILENSREEEISLSAEIQTLEYYLGMQKLRLEDKLTWTVRAENISDTSEILIPPMFAQPFIENAIEHGIGSMNHPLQVDVLFSLTSTSLVVTVTDNGIGFRKSAGQVSKKHKSLALEITRERLENYNRNRKNNITLSITDLSDENPALTGTRVRVSIPLN